ncbi:sulfatase-like hydrolase/transferase [Phycisphaeraceae bacterium D3-23]
MTSRLTTRLAFAFAMLSVWAAGAQPNIVLIMADDLGYGDLGCYGSEDQHTPHLDALADAGIRLTDYHSNGTVCSPTRAALMTGRYPQRTGVEGVVTAANHREVGLPLEEVTLAEVLRDAGYVTALFGKWHLGYDPRFGPTRQGFDTFEGFVSGNIDYQNKIDQVGEEDWWVGEQRLLEPGYLTTVITDRAVDWIGEQSDRPFFLYLSHGAPHYPYQGPDDPGFRVPGEARVASPRQDIDAAYREMITALDDSVGRVVAALETHGLEENTLIIFCSDNGCTGRVGSSGPWRGHKGQVYEGGHRVPFIAAWPGTIDAGEVLDDLAMSMDLLPTFAALAGAALPEGVEIDGVNLVDHWADGLTQPRRVHWRSGLQGAMREGRWKLVVRGDKDYALFDLDEDPAEQHDVSMQHGEIATAMRVAHSDWLRESRAGVERVSP